MKKHILTALLITTMISMTACGKTTDDVSASNDINTDVITESNTLPSVNDELKIGVVNKDDKEITPTSTPIPTATPVNTETPTPTITPVTTEVPKTTEAPAVTSTPAATEVPKTTEPLKATEAPKATEKPKSTENTTTTNTSTETKVESTPTPIPETPAPAPVETPAPAAVGCNHEKTWWESHDTHEVNIAGGCFDVYEYKRTMCSYCGEVLSDDEVYVNSRHHTIDVSPEIPPTCTEDGVATVGTCDCGGVGITGGHTLPATGHDYHDECTGEISEDLKTVKWHTICYKCGDVTNEWWE